MILLSIRDIVEGFAQRYGLNTWDWIALTITLTTLIVSSCALGVSRKTLKSQRQTEKNTAPVMDTEIQKYLIGEKMLELLDSLIFICSLDFFLKKKDYQAKPSSHFWKLALVPLDNLNESLYFNDNEKFNAFHKLIKVLKEYNSAILGFRTTLHNPNVRAQDIDFELFHSFESIGVIINTIGQALKICFNQDKEDVIQFIKKYFICCTEPNLMKSYRDKYYPSNTEGFAMPYVMNSQADVFLNYDYNVLAEALKRLSIFDSDEIDGFMMRLSKFVDVVIMTTPCDGKREELKSSNDVSDKSKDITSVHGKEWNVVYESDLSKIALPTVPKGLFLTNSWFYYITSSSSK